MFLSQLVDYLIVQAEEVRIVLPHLGFSFRDDLTYIPVWRRINCQKLISLMLIIGLIRSLKMVSLNFFHHRSLMTTKRAGMIQMAQKWKAYNLKYFNFLQKSTHLIPHFFQIHGDLLSCSVLKWKREPHHLCPHRLLLLILLNLPHKASILEKYKPIPNTGGAECTRQV